MPQTVKVDPPRVPGHHARGMRSSVPAILALALGCQSPAPKAPVEEEPSSTRSLPAPTLPLASVEAESPPPRESWPLPSGLSVGEVTQQTAIVWSRCDRAARLHAEVRFGETAWHQSTPTKASHDFTGRLQFDGLSPSREHQVRVWCSEPEDESARVRLSALQGSFKTAPTEAEPAAVRFAWGGDVGGQNVCRDAREGYPIFDTATKGRYDFFIALGDLIYADTPCKKTGAFGNAQVPREPLIASTLEGYLAHWRYNREDASLRGFLARTPVYAMWDDHEVINDFGPKTDLGSGLRVGEHLMPTALEAMLAYNPLPESGRLYRRIRWGRHVESFFVDTRSYRDENTRRDSKDRPKQMLGGEQIAWLLDALEDSDATWKFVISSVPLSIPTGLNKDARDGFANFDGHTGFEQELLNLLRSMRDRGIDHTIWLTTDVHMAAGFHYVPFPESPGFELYEFVSGPMSAAFFPRNVYDKTLNPTRLFTWAVDDVSAVRSYQDAKELFNYGEVVVSADGGLRVDIVNTFGRHVRGAEVVRRGD